MCHSKTLKAFSLASKLVHKHTGFSVWAQFIFLILLQSFIWWFTPCSQNKACFLSNCQSWEGGWFTSCIFKLSAPWVTSTHPAETFQELYEMNLRIDSSALVKGCPIGFDSSTLLGSVVNKGVQYSYFLVGSAWSQLQLAELIIHGWSKRLGEVIFEVVHNRCH